MQDLSDFMEKVIKAMERSEIGDKIEQATSRVN